jgi:hypothetical protein
VQRDYHFVLGAWHQRENVADKVDLDCVAKVTTQTAMRGTPPHGEGSVRIGWRGPGRVLRCSSCRTSEQKEWRRKGAQGERMK